MHIGSSAESSTQTTVNAELAQGSTVLVAVIKRTAAHLCWPSWLVSGNIAYRAPEQEPFMNQRPNPSVNRTSTSGLRPLAGAGYLKR